MLEERAPGARLVTNRAVCISIISLVFYRPPCTASASKSPDIDGGNLIRRCPGIAKNDVPISMDRNEFAPIGHLAQTAYPAIFCIFPSLFGPALPGRDQHLSRMVEER
jgi:hypothetical protein